MDAPEPDGTMSEELDQLEPEAIWGNDDSSEDEEDLSPPKKTPERPDPSVWQHFAQNVYHQTEHGVPSYAEVRKNKKFTTQICLEIQQKLHMVDQGLQYHLRHELFDDGQPPRLVAIDQPKTDGDKGVDHHEPLDVVKLRFERIKDGWRTITDKVSPHSRSVSFPGTRRGRAPPLATPRWTTSRYDKRPMARARIHC